MRFQIFVTALVLTFSIGSLCAGEKSPDRKQTSEEKIALALESQAQLEFIDTPLGDAFAYLADVHGIPIVTVGLDKKQLEEPVSLVLKKPETEIGVVADAAEPLFADEHPG